MTVPRRRRESGMSIPLLEGKTESRLPGPPEAHRREDSKDDPQNNVGVVPRNGPVADESEGDGRKKHGERGQEMWLHGLSSLWRRAAPSGPGIPRHSLSPLTPRDPASITRASLRPWWA